MFRIHILTVSLQEADQQPSHLFCLSFFSHFFETSSKMHAFPKYICESFHAS